MKSKTIFKQGRQVAIVACCLLMGGGIVQSCKDDDTVLTGQPAYLGNSIYERLQDYGNYTTLLKLIDDVEEGKTREVLSRTGSRTLFAADDAAYEKWFANTTWKTATGEPVRSYQQLSATQKKLLLNNCMLDNAYLVELMSNTKGNPPQTGMAVRRNSIFNIYDSVPIMKPEDMPEGDYWKELREAGKPVRIFKDNSRAPLIHFLPAFMVRHGFTNEDLSLLTNKEGNSIDEAWINGARIVNSDKPESQGVDYDIACKNGYIQKIDRVLEVSSNMAEIVHQHDELSTWAKMLDRFSAPYLKMAASVTKDEDDPSETQLAKFQRLYNTSDNVYTKRYFSSQTNSSTSKKMLAKLDNDSNTVAELSFDPGWNQYIYTNTSGEDLHYDAGAMLVPTNDAIDKWWNGLGSDLQAEYGTIENVPLKTISKLLNVNLLPNFVETIPTKFESILNDAKEDLGARKEHIVDCYMGCNGVVYVVNQVYTPAEFSSVVYPALAHPSVMSVIYYAIEDNNYLPYLLSMDQTYTMLLPENEAMKLYMDPVYYNTKLPYAISFEWDPVLQTVKADRYKATVSDDGKITLAGVAIEENTAKTVINNRLKDLVDQLIIIGDITTGYEFYKSKGGSYVRVTRENGPLQIQGAWQRDNNGYLTVDEDKDVTQKTNGKSVVLTEGIPLLAEQSVYQRLKAHKAFEEFLTLMEASGLDSKYSTSALLMSKDAGRTPAGGSDANKNIRLFSNYNYTVYVPSNESIQQLIADGYLPTWKDYKAQTANAWKPYAQGATTTEKNKNANLLADSAKVILRDMIFDFLRYHIQDNSLMIGAADNSAEYETMQRDTTTGRFYGIYTELQGKNAATGSLTLRNAAGDMTATVLKDKDPDDGSDLYNLQCREYWFKNGANASDELKTIYFVSDAVVHRIDNALMPSKAKMRKWQDVLDDLKQTPTTTRRK